MSHSENSRHIWVKAKELVDKGQAPYEAWNKLKLWALVEQKEPIAMHAAICEFLSKYATHPEAVSLLPEIMRDASHIASSVPTNERKRLLDLSEKASTNMKFPQNKSPQLDNRLKLNIQPSHLNMNMPDRTIYTPLSPTTDPEKLVKARDTMFSVNNLAYNIIPPVNKIKTQSKNPNQNDEKE